MQCREPSLIILPLRTTPLRSKNERGKIQTAIPRESLFGSVQRTQEEYRRQGNVIAHTALRLRQPTRMSFRGVKRRGNPLNRNATQWRLPLTALVLAITTAQKIFAISSSRDKNSCRSFARLSAWCVRLTARFPRSLRSLGMTRVGHPTPERTLIHGVLINGMCNFKDGTRAARRRESERRA